MYPLLGVVKIFISIDFSLVLSMVGFFSSVLFLLGPPCPAPLFFPQVGLSKKGPTLQHLGLFSLPREGTSEG